MTHSQPLFQHKNLVSIEKREESVRNGEAEENENENEIELISFTK